MMKFTKFENKEDHLDYLQVFIYIKVIEEKIAKFSIHDYSKTEFKDVNIKRYNNWVENGCIGQKELDDWFDNNAMDVLQFELGWKSDFEPKVVIWSDREKTDYYKEKLQMSFQFENHIASILKDKFGIDIEPYLTPEGQYELGENSLGIEIKNDTLIKKYGNVYIEYQEKSKASNYDYIDSGILKNDNSKYFLIGVEDDFYIFKKERLVEIYNEEINLQKKFKRSPRGTMFKVIATSRGMAIPVKNVKDEMISLEEMVEEIKKEKGIT